MWFSRVQGEDNRRGKRDPTRQLTPRGRRMTGSAAKRSGRCIMLELKERGVPGGEGTAILPGRRPADDGKRWFSDGRFIFVR